MPQLPRILSWLERPRPESRAVAARASLLHAILVTTFVIAGVAAITFPFVYELWLEALVVHLPLSPPAIPLLVALRRGRLEFVSRATVHLGAFAVIFPVLVSNGIRSPALIAFPASLMVAGFLSDHRGLFLQTVLFIAVLLFV